MAVVKSLLTTIVLVSLEIELLLLSTSVSCFKLAASSKKLIFFRDLLSPNMSPETLHP